MATRPARSRPPIPRPSPPARAERDEEIVRALNPEQARAVTTTEGPLLILAGRRLGQDARPGPPDRLPRRRQGRRAVADPRGHLHQPGRGRAPRADHQPGRRGRPRRRGRHVPRALRPRPARGRRGDRHRPPVRHLRHGRPAVADEADPARGGHAAHRRVPAERGPRCDQPGQERDARPDVPVRERRQPPRADHRPARDALPGAAAQASNALDFDDLLLEAVRLFEEAPDVLAKYQETLALPARRRIPGHQPGAVPVGQGARGHATATCASSATTTSRSTRGAARTCATSSTSSATGRTPRWSSSSRTTARRS